MYDYIEFIICYGEHVPVEEVRQRATDDNTNNRKTRKQEVVFARHLVIWFCVFFKLGTYQWIAGKFGLQHSTICNSLRAIQNYIDTDPVKRKRIEYYENILNRISVLIEEKQTIEGALKPLEHEIETLEIRLDTLNLKLEQIKTKVAV